MSPFEWIALCLMGAGVWSLTIIADNTGRIERHLGRIAENTFDSECHYRKLGLDDDM